MHHILYFLQWSNSSHTDPSRDLVPDIYSHNTDTWYSCDMHYLDYKIFLDWLCDFNLWSSVLVILWLCYMTITRPRHLSQHACTVLLYMIYRLVFSCYCYYFQFLTLSNILFFLFKCPTCTVTVFSYSLFYCSFPFVYSCWSALMDLYYFSVSRLESWYIELIIEHILLQLFSVSSVSFSWLILFRYGGWYCWWFCFSYICFYPYAWLYMHICVLSCSLLTT